MKKFLFLIILFNVFLLFSCKHNPETPEVVPLSLEITESFPKYNKVYNLYSDEISKLEPMKVEAKTTGEGVLTFSWYSHNTKSKFPLKVFEESFETTDGTSFASSYSPKNNAYLESNYYCVVNLSKNEEIIEKTTAKNLLIQKMPQTGLPQIFINTNNYEAVDSKEVWQENSSLKIVNTNGDEENYELKIKGRGNATWQYPKKTFKIKLSNKQSILGMKKDKDWVLLANYCDKTLMRSAIGFKTSELLGMSWTPKAEFVEFILNGEYLGNYQIAESVKEDKNRVNISDDGYLIERDGYYQLEKDNFVTELKEFGYSFKYPESEDNSNFSLQKQYIEQYMNTLEEVLYSEDPNAFNPIEGYQKYVDMDSLCKFFLVHNILQNKDMNNYMYKNDNTDNSLLCFGPAWDFEWSIGIGWYDGKRPNPNHDFITPVYYSRVIQDTYFKNAVKTLWNEKCPQISSELLEYIDSLSLKLSESQKLNFKRWPIMNEVVSVGGVPMGSFEKEVDCDKQFLQEHIQWLNEQIGAW